LPVAVTLWLVVDVVLTLAEDWRVPVVPAETAVLAGALDVCGDVCRGRFPRNGTIA
jgi:hypothetical protein